MEDIIKNKIELVCRRMLETRPKEEILLLPYVKPSFAKRNLRQNIDINLNDFFSDAKKGDYAYISIDLKSSHDTELSLLCRGASNLWIEFEEIPICGESYEQNGNEYILIHINVKKGYNRMVFKCKKSNKGFGLDWQISHVFYPFLWVCDYLLWERDTIALEDFRNEQGFSVSELVRFGEEKNYESCKTVFPTLTGEDKIIDFNILGIPGNYAFAVSYAKEDGELEIKSKNKVEIYVNGIKTNKIKCGDEIVVCCEKSADGWGFESCSNNLLHLPCVSSARKFHWLLLGGFSSSEKIDVQFVKPYKNAEDIDTFWRFASADTYLRP